MNVRPAHRHRLSVRPSLTGCVVVWFTSCCMISRGIWECHGGWDISERRNAVTARCECLVNRSSECIHIMLSWRTWTLSEAAVCVGDICLFSTWFASILNICKCPVILSKALIYLIHTPYNLSTSNLNE